MNRSRRRLLLGTAGAAAALLARAGTAQENFGAKPLLRDPKLHAKFQRPLRLPGATGLLAQRRLDTPLKFTARVRPFPLFDGAVSDLWCYASGDDHAFANPFLIGARDQTLDVTLTNRLGQDTTVHWHGLTVDEANDGSGLHPVRHDAQAQYKFTIANRAGLYWYHAHPHFHTGEQVNHGMLGPLLIEDAEELALRKRLGLKWLERDLPLLILDRQVARKNELKYRMAADDWIGNRVLVNWVPEPYYAAQPGLYRLRLANLSNARLLRPAFLHKGKPLPFHLIGTDGGLLARPWRVNDFFLGPAQRADVLLDLGPLAGERVVFASLAYDPMENDNVGAATEDPMLEHPGAMPMGDALEIMEFRVARGKPTVTAVPERLSTLEDATDAGLPRRTFRLRIADDGRWLINDWNFHATGHAPVFDVKRGTREVWEITNTMRSMPHPMHVHGLQFRVLSRSGSPRQVAAGAVASAGRSAQDLGCTDTVVVWPGETVAIVLDFSQPFSGRQIYMFHCHNLEHEDQGMMVSFGVVD